MRPLAFVIAAALMALSAASFAELACRYPVAAGEAAYAREAFGSNRIATTVGLLVIGIALVSAAAISIGSAGYLSVFVALPAPVLVTAVVVAMGGIAAWGVRQSVSFAGIMTLIEIGGLLLLIAAGVVSDAPTITRLPEVIPTFNPAALAGLVGTVLLAVFAFIGFEGLANVAEEVRQPNKTLPRAIFLTLAISTLLYVSVVWIALVSVGPSELARSQAPLALVFERLTGASPHTMSAIAVIATLNGIIVQIIMASRGPLWVGPARRFARSLGNGQRSYTHAAGCHGVGHVYCPRARTGVASARSGRADFATDAGRVHHCQHLADRHQDARNLFGHSRL